ncbi:DMT family transporter [Veillonella sp. ICM51a]|uniref:DMT family transporter n=1 Tax=Veillonella sp. ICM51a TaxID=936591 RepID=UPI00044CC792|nr:EamA family transporter [Veillonella sp. ICM51a]EUB22834.1 EamA-like transporter family protein [Veillonella sp. ICM51a]
MTNRMKAILGASATIAVWATAFPFGKVALQSVDALTLSVARVVGGAILMLIIGVFKGLHIPTSWREWGLYILLGATGNFVYQVVFNEGLRTIPAATSSIIMALTPMTTALMALVVYKDKIRLIGWIFTITAFIGVAVIIFWNSTLTIPMGAIWTLIGMILFAVYNILNRGLSLKGYNSITIAMWSMFTGAIMALPFADHAIEMIGAAPITAKLAMVYLAFFSSALGFVFWSYAFEHAEKVSDVTNFMYISPIVAAVVAAFLLGLNL